MRCAMKNWIASILALVCLSACQTMQSTSPGAVGIVREQQIMGAHDSASRKMNSDSALAYGETLKAASKKNELNADPAMTERVRQISNRLIEQVGVFRPDARSWKWEVNVLVNPELNAWCMPGGKIAVFSGLITKLQLTDDELAAVIGHEISHALREHALEREPRVMMAQVGSTLAGVAAARYGYNLPPELTQTVSMAALVLPNSRIQESEADRMGLELAARAGYNPRAAITLWEKMGRSAGGAPPKFLSSHPPSDERARELEATIPLVQPLYEAAKKD